MTPDEYENVVAAIVGGICHEASDLNDLALGFGRTNRLLGASGYKHQIDVSVSGSRNIYAIECKRWEAKIGVDEVMVLAARGSDILQANVGVAVHPILATRVGATRGAKVLAKHFGVSLEIVQSAQEFGLRIGRHVSVGVAASLSVSDEPFGVVTRNGAVVEA